MARVKLRCIMGCPGLKSSYWEKGLLACLMSTVLCVTLKMLCFRTVEGEFVISLPLLIIVAFIVPVMVVSFQAHRLLFSFDYGALENDGQGVIDFAYFFQAEAIQLFFICFTFFALSFIEAKYNKLDLRVVYKSSSWMEICSRFIIFFWCLFFLLTSETLLPTAGFCDKDDICTCEFDINKTQYGCNRNKTGM